MPADRRGDTRGDTHGGRRRERRHGRDLGQVAIEYLGFIPILLLVAMAGVQIGLVAYTGQQAGTAARTAARSASLNGDYTADGRRAMSDWLADGAGFSRSGGGDTVTVTATVDVPSIIPGWHFDPVSSTATMPVDH
ncbi:TadE/TadG family type IV pilus assembly protein [Streptomyces sp. NPDC090306]|uniref:TadE/TadG family type IV pilus assembly protein n=1 Tax=Streptomyces sp. NPDC090306 TaxID=3365961 RepID=UPI00382FF5AB